MENDIRKRVNLTVHINPTRNKREKSHIIQKS